MENCSNYVDLYPDASSNISSRLIFLTIYTLIFIFGLAGNIAIVYITMLNSTMQSVQNMFILNLAVADIIMCLLSVPITPITLIYKMWYFGTIMCHVIPWVQGSSIFITSFFLTAIAFNRYLLVRRPHTQTINKSRAKCITLLIWILSASLPVPYACYMRIITFPGLCGEFCDEDWPENAVVSLQSFNIRRVFTIGCLIVQFLIPLSFILLCYGSIFYDLRKRTKAKISKFKRSSDMEQRQMSHVASNGCKMSNPSQIQAYNLLKQNQRTNLILSCMVLSFGMSWLPYSLNTILSEYYPHYIQHNIRYLVYLNAHCIAMLNCVLNPVLYACLNSSFKSAVLTSVRGSKHRNLSLLINRVLNNNNNTTYAASHTQMSSRVFHNKSTTSPNRQSHETNAKPRPVKLFEEGNKKVVVKFNIDNRIESEISDDYLSAIDEGEFDANTVQTNVLSESSLQNSIIVNVTNI